MLRTRTGLILGLAAVLVVMLFLMVLALGSVNIPFSQIVTVLLGEVGSPSAETAVAETAAVAGAATAAGAAGADAATAGAVPG